VTAAGQEYCIDPESRDPVNQLIKQYTANFCSNCIDQQADDVRRDPGASRILQGTQHM
jgi:hypothetical protein